MNNYHCTNNCGGPCPPPASSQPDHGCLCGDSFRRALQLLCRSPISTAINFNAFCFVTGHYLLGSALQAPTDACEPGDNLVGPAAAYLCGDGCSDDAVSGLLYPPVPGAQALCNVIHQVHLCRVKALAFDALADPTGASEPFDNLVRGLEQLLQTGCDCGPAKTITLAVGPLVVEQGTILGQLGNLLVISNAAAHRIYLVCTTEIDYLG